MRAPKLLRLAPKRMQLIFTPEKRRIIIIIISHHYIDQSYRPQNPNFIKR